MPFYDLRLLRFVFEKVSWHLIHDWRTPYKHVLREAQKGTVPEATRNRKKNEFHFDGFFQTLFEQNEDYIRSLFQSGDVDRFSFIDKSELQKTVDKRFFGINNNSTRALISLLFYLIWLQTFQKVPLYQADASP
jgi:hypothetical protein